MLIFMKIVIILIITIITITIIIIIIIMMVMLVQVVDVLPSCRAAVFGLVAGDYRSCHCSKCELRGQPYVAGLQSHWNPTSVCFC